MTHLLFCVPNQRRDTPFKGVTMESRIFCLCVFDSEKLTFTFYKFFTSIIVILYRFEIVFPCWNFKSSMNRKIEQFVPKMANSLWIIEVTVAVVFSIGLFVKKLQSFDLWIAFLLAVRLFTRLLVSLLMNNLNFKSWSVNQLVASPSCKATKKGLKWT